MNRHAYPSDPFVRDGEEACWDLPAAPETASVARRLVPEALATWSLSGLADDMAVVVSEVVTNAVVHAKSAMSLSLRRQDCSVRAEVVDRSPVGPAFGKIVWFAEGDIAALSFSREHAKIFSDAIAATEAILQNSLRETAGLSG